MGLKGKYKVNTCGCKRLSSNREGGSKRKGEGERERGRVEEVFLLSTCAGGPVFVALLLSVCFKGHSMLMAIYLRKEFRFFLSLFFLFLLFCCCIEDIRNLFVSVPTQTSVGLTD